MRKIFIAAAIIAGLGWTDAGADACTQSKKLRLDSVELLLIITWTNGNGQELGEYSSDYYKMMYEMINDLSNYSPYNKMLFDPEAFVKKATQRQKAAFAKKGLKWNGGNVMEEASNKAAAFQQSQQKCNARQKGGKK